MQTANLLGIFFSFYLQTSQAAAIDPMSNKNWVIIHGAMMSAAVVLIFPCGLIMARHMKLILKDAKVRDVHVWFHLHRGMQVLGFIVFIIGIAFAYSYLDVDNLNGLPGLYACGQAHMVLGNIVAGMFVLQVVFGFVRPHPGPGPLRSLWTIFHHWLGRLAIACSWVVVLLGIYIGHSFTAYLLDYRQWLIPMAVIMGIWVLLDIVLSIQFSNKTKSGQKWQG